MPKGNNTATDLEAFGILLRRYRVMNGLTQADFSDLLGVSQATLSRWENGSQAPDVKMRRKVHDLVFRKQPKQDNIINNFVRFARQPRMLMNRDFIFLAVSPTLSEYVGRTQNELVGSSHRERLSEQAKRFFPRLIDAGFFKGEVAFGQFAAHFQGYDGRDFKSIKQIYPFFLSDGSIVALVEIQLIDDETFKACQHSPDTVEMIRAFEDTLV